MMSHVSKKLGSVNKWEQEDRIRQVIMTGEVRMFVGLITQNAPPSIPHLYINHHTSETFRVTTTRRCYDFRPIMADKDMW